MKQGLCGSIIHDTLLKLIFSTFCPYSFLFATWGLIYRGVPIRMECLAGRVLSTNLMNKLKVITIRDV